MPIYVAYGNIRKILLHAFQNFSCFATLMGEVPLHSYFKN